MGVYRNNGPGVSGKRWRGERLVREEAQCVHQCQGNAPDLLFGKWLVFGSVDGLGS